MLSLGVLKEKNKENKVFIIPENISELIDLGYRVYIESNAGLLSGFENKLYIKNGAYIVSKNDIWSKDIILMFNFFYFKYINLLKLNCNIICFNISDKYKKYLKLFYERKITLIILKNIPRLSKYQYMDISSSMSYISGYRAVVESLYEYRKIFSHQIVFSGKIESVKVLVIGVGVSGLTSIGLFKSLGSDVYAYDLREETKDQVKSLGAKFIKIKNFYLNFSDFLLNNIFKFNIIVITVANKNNLKFISKKLINLMKRGSIIVDLTMRDGGSCDVDIKGDVCIYKNKIKIISYYDYTRLMPELSSFLCSNNLLNFLKFILDEEKILIYLNFDDSMINNVVEIYKGKLYKKKIINEINYKDNKSILNFRNKKENNLFENQFRYKYKKKINCFMKYFLIFLIFFIPFLFLNYYSLKFINHFVIFVISCLLGYKLIDNVEHVFHTPLISLTNAISGIIFIGCLTQIGYINNFLNKIFSLFSLFLVSINIFSGFYITIRMLKMFVSKN